MNENLRERLRSIVKDTGINNVFHIARSITIESRALVFIEIAKIIQEEKISLPGFKDFIEESIESVNDIILAYAHAEALFGCKKNVPLSVKKGIAQSFNKFTEDEFLRGDVVSLRQVLKTVHPTPKDEKKSLIFKKLCDGTIGK